MILQGSRFFAGHVASAASPATISCDNCGELADSCGWRRRRMRHAPRYAADSATNQKIVQKKKLGRDGEGPKHGIGLDSRLLSPYSRRDSSNTEAWKRFPGAGVARCGYDAKLTSAAGTSLASRWAGRWRLTSQRNPGLSMRGQLGLRLYANLREQSPAQFEIAAANNRPLLLRALHRPAEYSRSTSATNCDSTKLAMNVRHPAGLD